MLREQAHVSFISFLSNLNAWPSLASGFSRSFTKGFFFLESGIESFEESKSCSTGRNEAGSWRICSQSGWECGPQDVPAHQKAGFSLYRGWRPPIWTPNVKLLINYLRQISAFEWTLVLYFSLCITRFIIPRTDNTISGTHGITFNWNGISALYFSERCI